MSYTRILVSKPVGFSRAHIHGAGLLGLKVCVSSTLPGNTRPFSKVAITNLHSYQRYVRVLAAPHPQFLFAMLAGYKFFSVLSSFSL